MHPAFCLHSSSRSFKRETCLCFANFNPSWIPHENEAVTFEILRDVNSVVCHRSSDPLSPLWTPKREDASGRPYLACEACRAEFAVTVDIPREEFGTVAAVVWYRGLTLGFAMETISSRPVVIFQNRRTWFRNSLSSSF